MSTIELNRRSVAVNPLSVIDKIIAELELTPTQYNDATKNYNAVAAVLQELLPAIDPTIHPQGSMRAGTTVRPTQDDRFDLDMICRLMISGKQLTPEEVYDMVWDALGKHETYRRMRKRKNCCIRLEYAPERKFYLDVTPAIPDWARTDLLYVPDRDRKRWNSTNPIGFCDGWFLRIADIEPTILRPLSARRGSSESTIMANAYVEPMPEFGEFEKTPLQRIVQMLKRDRNEHFQNDQAHRPSSILLTTVITQSYERQASTPSADLLDFVVKVVANLADFVHVSSALGSQRFHVLNPVNGHENFAQGWTEEHYKRFRVWHRHVSLGMEKLQESKGRGVDVMLNRLSESFGRERVLKAARALGADTNALHDAGKLCVNGGTIGSVGATIPKTVYFGGAK